MDHAPRDLSRFSIRRQPDDTTCGPTCLQAVYSHYGLEVPFAEIDAAVPRIEGGGTLGVHLATDALRRGFRVRVLTWNLEVFDPSWYALERGELVQRLRARAAANEREKTSEACEAYAAFLEAGGRIEFTDLDAGVLRRFLRRGVPILTGLSATFLYRESRELPDGRPDDVRGDPCGHFVVLTGYRTASREVIVSDPLHPNPLATVHTYPVPTRRLVGAIFLGVMTYDANLVVVEPPPKKASRSGRPPTDANDRRHESAG